MIDSLHPDLRVIDGAMATELERRGADLSDPLWSAKVLIEQPQLVEAVHYDYFAAGADIALSASYQATFAGFERRGLDAGATRAALRSAVDLACRARERFLAAAPLAPGRQAPLVAASIGPFGAHRHDGSEYHGNYGVDGRTLQDFHRRQLEVLAQTSADFIAFETVPSLLEAESILRLLEEFPGLRAWISFSCADGGSVCHGEAFADCVAAASGSGQILATGLNCTPPQFVRELLDGAAQRSECPLFVYPNSGECWNAEARAWEGASGGLSFAQAADAWFEAGARLVGGCCRTSPADIAAVSALVRGRAD